MKINCRTILISLDSVNCSLLSPRRYSRLHSTNDPDSTLNHNRKGQYNLISLVSICAGHVPIKIDFTRTFTWITSSWHQKKLTQPKTYGPADCCPWIRALLAYCHKKAWNNQSRLKMNPRGVKQMAQETSNPLWKKYCFEITEENSTFVKTRLR